MNNPTTRSCIKLVFETYDFDENVEEILELILNEIMSQVSYAKALGDWFDAFKPLNTLSKTPITLDPSIARDIRILSYIMVFIGSSQIALGVTALIVKINE